MSNEIYATAGLAGVPLRPHGPRNTVDLTTGLQALDDAMRRHGQAPLAPVNVRIGAQIHRARILQNLTQAELAMRSGVPQGRISAIEAGKGAKGPTLDVISRLTTALGLEVDLTPTQAAAEAAAVAELTVREVVTLTSASYDHSMGRVLVQISTGSAPNISPGDGRQIEWPYDLGRPWGVWQAPAHAVERVTVRAASMVVHLSGAGAVRVIPDMPGQPPAVRAVEAAPGDQVEIISEGDEPLLFMTYPLNTRDQAV